MSQRDIGNQVERHPRRPIKRSDQPPKPSNQFLFEPNILVVPVSQETPPWGQQKVAQRQTASLLQVVQISGAKKSSSSENSGPPQKTQTVLVRFVALFTNTFEKSYFAEWQTDRVLHQ
jgi:hypothetical protein